MKSRKESSKTKTEAKEELERIRELFSLILSDYDKCDTPVKKLAFIEGLMNGIRSVHEAVDTEERDRNVLNSIEDLFSARPELRKLKSLKWTADQAQASLHKT